MKNFLPVEVFTKNTKGNYRKNSWYIDISSLNISDLIELKKELNGKDINGIAVLDRIIHEEIGYEYGELKSIKRQNKRARELKTNTKKLVRMYRENGRN